MLCVPAEISLCLIFVHYRPPSHFQKPSFSLHPGWAVLLWEGFMDDLSPLCSTAADLGPAVCHLPPHPFHQLVRHSQTPQQWGYVGGGVWTLSWPPAPVRERWEVASDWWVMRTISGVSLAPVCLHQPRHCAIICLVAVVTSHNGWWWPDTDPRTHCMQPPKCRQPPL